MESTGERGATPAVSPVGIHFKSPNREENLQGFSRALFRGSVPALEVPGTKEVSLLDDFREICWRQKGRKA